MKASSLVSAHRGYQYQDLISAIALVDMLLLRTSETIIDRKLFSGDLFDDLTISSAAGRHRLQLKHSSDPDAVLKPSVFSGDARGVRLDLLISALLADRAAFPSRADVTQYRVVFTAHLPVAGELTNLLHGTTLGDAGPLAGLGALAWYFEPAELWELKSKGGGQSSIAGALSNLTELSEEDLEWVCARLSVETSALPFSGDLLAPGPAEELLLGRVRDEVGAGSFPNADRAAADVAAGLILAAVSARTGLDEVDVDTLIRRTRLRTDFGAVTAATPVVREREVSRNDLVVDLVRRIEDRSVHGDALVLSGPPGQGKSWVSDQVTSRLKADGWLVAEHYCFLGEADNERDDRVLLDAIFGSLMARLAEADGKLVTENVPRFAADRSTLEQSLRTATRDGERRVALVVDGLDHISRVVRTHRSADASLVVCEALALLSLPANVVLVILSQPGDHLAPFAETDYVELPGMTREELAVLIERQLGHAADSIDPGAQFLDALVERSAGNALYATYLCFESTRRDFDRYPTRTDVISALPAYDSTLKGYYEYLYAELDDPGWVVAEQLAVVNFAMTREELKQLRSPSRVDAALHVLSPVLREQVGSGIRFYHESFGRFVRERLAQHPEDVDALLSTINDWLIRRGLFDDQRAFQWLIPTMAEQGRHVELLALVDDDFVETAIANAFSLRGITANLACASESAAVLADWPGVIRLVQMANAAHTFDFDCFETLVEFTDVLTNFIKPQLIADRLVDGERLVVTGRQGVLRCAALDAAGAVAPWSECLAAYERERKADNVHRGPADEQLVGLAVLRGRLRLETTGRSARDLNWRNIAKYVDRLEASTPAVVDLIRDVVGLDFVQALAEHSAAEELFVLELAERESEYRDFALSWVRSNPRRLAGSAHRWLALGFDAGAISRTTAELREQLLQSTRKVVIEPSSSRPNELEEWLDLCSIAARLDTLGLASAEALVQGEGWYRCWLEFAIEMARLETEGESRRADAPLDLLRILEKETNPFSGKPRATDLYWARGTIADTVKRALQLVVPEHWAEALEILSRVSRSTTTIAMGFAGGPLPAEVLASIAEEVAPDRARGTLRTHLQSQIADAGADVFYREVAEYHLRLARLDLQDGATETAAEHWRLGISFLTAYGSHKDATLFELTEPLGELSELNRSAVKRALQRLQSITLAVENHTDGRGTNRVHSDWWTEVARVDPVWLIDLALPELVDHVNSSHWALQRAVEEVWTAHHTRADPRISAAVRVAVEATLIASDPADLERYLDAGVLDEDEGNALLRAVMSRFDERATSSTYTNAKEILDQTEQLVERVNATIATTVLPRVTQVRPARAVQKEDDRWGVPAGSDRAIVIDWSNGETFAPGLPGVYEVIQVVRRRRGTSEGSGLGPDAYQNAIGYRLLGLDEDGRVSDAEQALFALADALPFGENPTILTSLSDGFSRLGRGRLAAAAGVLAWTRTRQRGGWGAFGAQANLDHLARAFNQNDAVAREVLGREIAHAAVLRSASGPTQALIHAAGAGVLPWRSDAADAAMRCWDAACDVVERRTPLLSASDASEYPYLPTDAVDLSQTDINRCVAAVALARVCLPGREAKRRALVAVRDLLQFRPDSIVRDLRAFMVRLSDPVTQHALMSVVLTIPGIADELQSALAKLARSDLLSIRSLARRHMHEPAELPVSSPPRGILAQLRGTDWGASPDARVVDAVSEFVGSRIAATAALMPELESSLIARLSHAEAWSNCKERVSSQLEALASRARPRWPDAVLADEEEVERELQILAGAARTARIVLGEPMEYPANWEAAVGARLGTNTQIAMAIESVRIPRPNMPAAPLPDDPAWSSDAQVRGTIRFEGDLPDLGADEWVCVGLFERREHDGKRWNAKGSVSVTIGGVYAGEPDPGDIPLGGGSLRWWGPSDGRERLPPRPFPLVAMSQDLSGPTGLGVPQVLLTPTPALRGVLGLEPTDRPFLMSDGEGTDAARLVVWRAEYEVSDYELAFPRVQGQALVIRPDLMAKLKTSLPFDMRQVIFKTLFDTPEAGEE